MLSTENEWACDVHAWRLEAAIIGLVLPDGHRHKSAYLSVRRTKKTNRENDQTGQFSLNNHKKAAWWCEQTPIVAKLQNQFITFYTSLLSSARRSVLFCQASFVILTFCFISGLFFGPSCIFDQFVLSGKGLFMHTRMTFMGRFPVSPFDVFLPELPVHKVLSHSL